MLQHRLLGDFLHGFTREDKDGKHPAVSQSMSTGNSLNSRNLLRRWNTPQSEWSLGAKVSHPIPQGLTIQSPKVFHWIIGPKHQTFWN